MPRRVVSVQAWTAGAAHDQALVRGGCALVDSAGDLESIGEAGNGAAAVELARLHKPDIVLMDIHMPGMNGLTATRKIMTDPALDGTRVVMLTTYKTDETVFEALRAGASGFLLKDVAAGCPTARSPSTWWSAARPSRRTWSHLLSKLGARDRAQLVVIGRGTGAVDYSVASRK